MKNPISFQECHPIPLPMELPFSEQLQMWRARAYFPNTRYVRYASHAVLASLSFFPGCLPDVCLMSC
jgi:hypothetical protein